MANCAKCRKDGLGLLVGCEGICDRWYHHTCIGMSDSEFKLLNKSKNLFYLCENCRRSSIIVDKACHNEINNCLKQLENKVVKLPNVDDIINKFKEDMVRNFESALENTVSRIESLISPKLDEIRNIPSVTNYDKPLYSKVLTNKNSVIIKPKDNSQRNSLTKTDLFRSINPVREDVCVSKVKNVGNGGLIISCDTNDEVKKFKEIAASKLADKYEVKEVTNLHPRIKVVGLTEKLADEEILHLIKSQNKHIFDEICDLKIVKVSTVRNKSSVYQITLQLDPNTYVKAIKNGKMFIGYDYCSVYDALEIRACFKCCGYNHIANNCSNSIVCPKCAGNHRVQECNPSAPLKCVHCANVKGKQNLDINVDHASWDKKNCYVYKQKLVTLRHDILNIK